MENSKIIAIDPDVDKSGVAVMDREKQFISVDLLMFPDVLDEVEKWKTKGYDRVVIEAGWHHRKANFHGGNIAVAQKIAHDVGLNHATGRLMVQMLQRTGIVVEEVPPLVKRWNGTGGKITHTELLKLIPWLPYKRTNQDARDAILLAWVYCKRHYPNSH